jgi:GTPase SAR1 family protein
VQRLVIGGCYESIHSRVIAHFVTYIIEWEPQLIKLHICDIPGSTRDPDIHRVVCHEVRGLVFTYDITNRDSLNKVEMFLKSANDGRSGACRLLVATKADLKARWSVSPK